MIILVYRSPSLSSKQNSFLIETLSNAIRCYKTTHEIILLGDFNLADLDWNTCTVNCPINSVDQRFLIQKSFCKLFSDHNLSWALDNQTVTRWRNVNNSLQMSTLDNVLFSDKEMLKNTHVMSGLGKSDIYPYSASLE